jgi:diguanylate cyclase (GGDEF)-like protein
MNVPSGHILSWSGQGHTCRKVRSHRFAAERKKAQAMHDPHEQLAEIPSPSDEQENAHPSPTGPARSSAKRIALLGDNALLARDTALQLRHAGYEVAVVTQMEQLALLLKKQVMTCILVDSSTRDSRFADPACAVQIREYCATPIPILWLASRNNFETRLAAVRADVDGYFAKPVDIGVLKECIESIAHHVDKQRYRVLAVGSDVARLATLERTLTQAGMEVLRLQKPLDLIGTLSQHHPELIVMDVHTTTCNGIDLAKLIRQDKTFLDLPVLILAEDKSPEMRRRAVLAGVDDYLTLPVPPEDLVFYISSRIERSRTLRTMIMCDGLTGLYNHRSIKEHLGREIARSVRERTPLSLAMVDIDFFKKVNDTYGHPVGDQVIRAISQILRQRLRRGDLIGRYGGEEFAVILPTTSAAVAASVLNEIRESFGKLRHKADDSEFSTTFSAGVADLGDVVGLANVGEMFRIADMALYQAKQAGRNRVELAQRYVDGFEPDGH